MRLILADLASLDRQLGGGRGDAVVGNAVVCGFDPNSFWLHLLVRTSFSI